jgi:hypothetical protein
MEISVDKILPHEDKEINVTVGFFDESTSPHNSASVTVFIEQKDYTLSELKVEAVRKAKEFLSQAIDAS